MWWNIGIGKCWSVVECPPLNHWQIVYTKHHILQFIYLNFLNPSDYFRLKNVFIILNKLEWIGVSGRYCFKPIKDLLSIENRSTVHCRKDIPPIQPLLTADLSYPWLKKKIAILFNCRLLTNYIWKLFFLFFFCLPL